MLIICLWILLANVKMRLFIVEHIEVLELEMVWGRSDTEEHMLLPHTHTNKKKTIFPSQRMIRAHYFSETLPLFGVVINIQSNIQSCKNLYEHKLDQILSFFVRICSWICFIHSFDANDDYLCDANLLHRCTLTSQKRYIACHTRKA